MIRTRNLVKRYDQLTAVDNLNIHVQKGEIYGFLGPNGAGKTTTIMMLLGMEPPTQGEIRLFGKKPQEDYFQIRRQIGVLSEFQYLYEDMTALEYLRFFARLYQVDNPDKKIQEVMSRLNFWSRRDGLLEEYSKGMKQKLGMARALLADPQLLILDEPVSSLDPYGIREIRDVIMEENARGKTLFISSHILSEIERTCHRVGIMNKGRLLAEDDMTHLKQRLRQDVELVVELEELPEHLVEALEIQPYVISVVAEGNLLRIKTDAETDHRAKISQLISGSGGVIIGMTTRELSLEDAFITITENNLSLLTKEGEAS